MWSRTRLVLRAATPALRTSGFFSSSSSSTCSPSCFDRALFSSRRWCSNTAESRPPLSSSSSSSGEGDAAASKSIAPVKRKIQIAVVGSGPSGCFVAGNLIKKHPDLHVDILERLPVPFGLSRYGVAPDHPDVKNVEKQFMELFKSGRVTWIGNVAVGKAVPVSALLQHYAAVVFATGAEGSKKLNIPGEELGGVLPARDVVNYYNTLPFPYGAPRFCPFDIEKTQRAVVIGNGNVAMDVVRVLGATYSYFGPTDMNCVCVKELMKNKIHHVDVVGRRGVETSAFGTAEFREMATYEANRLRVEVDDFDLDRAIAAIPEGKVMRAHKRMMELVHKFVRPSSPCSEKSENNNNNNNNQASPSKEVGFWFEKEEDVPQSVDEQLLAASVPVVVKDNGEVQRPRASERGPCTVRFRYNLTPVAILPQKGRRNYVGGVLFKATSSSSSQETHHHHHQDTPKKNNFLLIPCNLVLSSIGYRSDAVAEVPFDHKNGVMKHERGRVTGMPRVYCSGWVKNGARGAILYSVVDAQETAATILHDIASGVIPSDGVDDEVEHAQEASTKSSTTTTMYGKYGLVDYFLAKGVQPVSLAGLERIFHVETQRGIDLGKRLEKMDSVRDMLDVALGGEVGRKVDERVRGMTPARSEAMMYLKELLDDETDLAPFAKELAQEMPRKMGEQHPHGRIAPSQL